jgi:signal peptidase
MASATTPRAKTHRSPTRTLVKLCGSLLLWLGMAAAVLMVGSSLLGYQRYIITGQSMTGTIDRGSIVWDRVVPTSSLKVGDIITYDPASPMAPAGDITHRIVWKGRDAEGRLGFRTKGDYNGYEDPWRFTLGPRQAKEVFHLPYAGYALAYLSEPRFRMIVIGVPALLVALAVLAGLWKEAGEEAAREKSQVEST